MTVADVTTWKRFQLQRRLYTVNSLAQELQCSLVLLHGPRGVGLKEVGVLLPPTSWDLQHPGKWVVLDLVYPPRVQHSLAIMRYPYLGNDQATTTHATRLQSPTKSPQARNLDNKKYTPEQFTLNLLQKPYPWT